jgi:hypothetical protein
MTRPWSDITHSSAYPIVIPAQIDISEHAKESEVIDLDGLHLFALGTPPVVTSTWVNFQVSTDNITFLPLHDTDGEQLSAVIAANRMIVLNQDLFAAFRFLKIVAGSDEAADRTFTLIARSI